MSDFRTPPPAARRGSKRARSALKGALAAAETLNAAAFAFTDSPDAGTAKSRRGEGATGVDGDTRVRSMKARTGAGASPNTLRRRSKLLGAMRKVKAANARAARTAAKLGRAGAKKALQAASEGGAARVPSRSQPKVPGNPKVVKVAPDALPLPPVHGLRTIASSKEVDEEWQRNYIRAGQLARLNLARALQAAIASASAGRRGEEFLALAAKARGTGRAHETLTVTMPVTRGAFLRLFGERLGQPVSPFGVYATAGKRTAALLLSDAQEDSHDLSGIMSPSGDARVDWAGMGVPVRCALRPMGSRASLTAPLTATLLMGKKGDAEVMCDSLLPRPQALQWQVGAFLSAAGVVPVHAVPLGAGKVSATWAPDADTEAKSAAAFDGATRGKPSSIVDRVFLMGTGTMTLKLPLAYVPGKAPTVASSQY